MARQDALLRLHKTLMGRRSEILKKLEEDLENLRNCKGEDPTGDTADVAFEAGSDEMASHLAELDSRELGQIERALVKLKQGTYGQCEGCQDKIPVGRLNALPYTTLCIACQREMEQCPEYWESRRAESNWEKVFDSASLRGSARGPSLRHRKRYLQQSLRLASSFPCQKPAVGDRGLFSCIGTSVESAIAGQVDFDVRETDLALIFHALGGVVHLFPVAFGAAALPVFRALLHLALAVDAQGCVGQGVEPADGNPCLAALALPVGALFELHQGSLDLTQLAGIQLGQVRGHLIGAGLKSNVGGVAGRIFALEIPEVVQVLSKLFQDLGSTTHEGLVQA